MTSLQIEKSFVSRIVQMDRPALVQALLTFQGRVHLDFTEQFLDRQTTEWLRHVLLAAQLHCR